MDTTEAQALVDRMQPDTVWRIDYPAAGWPEGEKRTIHVRAVVDGEYIVYKEWSRRKMHWRYHVEWRYAFELKAQSGALQYVRKEQT